jgi:hypothetical protein
MDPSQCVGAPDVMEMHGKSDTTVPLDPWGLGSLELLAGAAGCGPWKSGEFPKGKWTTFPTKSVDPTPCQEITGCRGTLSYCWYDGEHQIPSWYPAANLDYPTVTMAYFRAR